MARKTIEVATLHAWVNSRLATPDSSLHLSELTPEQAFRLGAASLYASIAHATGNYHGFNYPGSERNPDGTLREDHDDTRRVYYPPR